MIKTTKEIEEHSFSLCNNVIFQNTKNNQDFHKIFIEKKWISIDDINNIPSKSLGLTGLDLCGYSQDDVWERAINWFKGQIKGELDDKD